MDFKSKFNQTEGKKFIEEQFDKSVLPSLSDYIKIPNLSRAYDSDWQTNGLLEQAAKFLSEWVSKQNVKGLKLEIIQEKQRTPLIFMEIDATKENTGNLFFYGHFDKQPHMTGWDEGLGPITPVVRNDKLYGRGGADDGYSIYASILSIKACQEQNLPHPRCTILIEGDEESGSIDLPFYLEILQKRIGTPDLIICLDSFCFDYETLWLTSSLRGMVAANIKVKVLKEGAHSGGASGIVSSSFRIMRQLLDRLENAQTGEVNQKFQVNVPVDKYQQLYDLAQKAGKKINEPFAWHNEMQPQIQDPFQSLIANTWKASVAYVGMDGFPTLSNAGNVLRPETTCKISLRLPPTLDPKKAAEDLKELLLKDPPYDAEVDVQIKTSGSGFNAPDLNENIRNSLENASKQFFNDKIGFCAGGGSIPFLNMLQNKYPQASFAVAGVLGPQSNAHAPNEFLHIPYTKKLICCMAQVVADCVKK